MREALTGPKSLDDWIRIYQERDSDTEYVTYPGERICWDPGHGFFTYYFDAESRLLCVPKMCGDGKFWRKLIYEMAFAARDICRGVYCCTKRDPKVYMRVLGGTLIKQERKENGQVISFILITFDDTKEGRH